VIPLKITIKNFLSYGPEPQEITFEPYQMICLSGRNGHGKSSILDAITWAVWGVARKVTGTSKADEGLVHLGQTQMLVNYDFIASGQRYRIRREYFKGSAKALVALDFEVADEAGESFITLTDKSIRATQSKIEEVVGVDYQTFVNTSFLRQGQSNEFSKKTPRERKHVLAAILGLDTYDAYAARAQESVRRHDQEIKTFEKLILHHSEQAEGKATILSLQKEYQGKIDSVKKKITEEQKALKAAEQEQTKILEDFARVDAYVEQHAGLVHAYEQDVEAFINDAASWRRSFKALGAECNYEQLRARQSKLELEEGTLRVSLNEYREKEKQLVLLKQDLFDYDRSQEKIFNQNQRKISEEQIALEGSIKQCDHMGKKLEDDRVKLTTQLNDQKALFAKIDALIRDDEKQAEIYHKLVETFDAKKSSYQKLNHEYRQLEIDSHDLGARAQTVEETSSSSCPLCEQLLTVRRKKFLASKLSKESLCKSEQRTRVASTLEVLKKELKELHERLTVEKDASLERAKRQQQHKDLSVRVANGTTELEQCLSECKRIEKQREELIQKKGLLVKQAEGLGKDYQAMRSHDAGYLSREQAYKVVEKDLVASKEIVSAYEKVLSELDKARALRAAAEKGASDKSALQDQRKNLRVRYEQLTKQRSLGYAKKLKLANEKQKALKETQAALKQRIQQEMAALTGQEQELRQLEADAARISAQIDQCDKHVDQVAKLKDQIAKVQVERDDYQVLAQAFGKNGIQALMIEQVVPEIEQEANRLLARLTDNQTQIFIESLRDLKRGGVRETLDIKISDAVGIRPYEMFSGGEAFRIDFALRIAISKLLARRAGTSLQTLFIDEGFGSQDDDGISRLTDALYAIQEDFEKVIIVSHLARIKDTFPAHFIVEKGATGSRVSVEERG
jgi:exonuclease SbcC